MPGLLEHNATSHLIWLVGGAIWAALALVVALDLVQDLAFWIRNHLRHETAEVVGTAPPPPSPSEAEPAEPGHSLAGRLLHRVPRLASRFYRPIVPVRRTWTEGRLNEPLDEE